LKDNIAAVVTALTAVGTFTFGVQRIAYERYYDQFGLTPEEVGIDATRVLQQTASGLAVGTVIIVGGFGAAALALHLASGGRLNLRRYGKGGVTACLAATIFVVGTFLVLNVAHADDAARCVARSNGEPVRGLRVTFLGLDVTRLSVRADRAVLHSADRQAHYTWDGRRVVYLGTAQSTVFAYDRKAKRTLRLPASGVVVSTNTTSRRYHAKEGCRAAKQNVRM
jgi:hypothetical protein